jgi:hypothetical protein
LLTSPAGYFRVDVCSSGKNKEFWKLDIQDNTGKYKFKGQPLSSVFAIVRIPKATELSCLELADLIDKSQATGQEQVKLPEAIRPQQVSKAHKKKLWHKP